MTAIPAQTAPASAPVPALSEQVLPALAARRKACLDLLGRSNCTLSDVVGVIVTDPGLTVAVLQTVNRKRGDSRTRIASVESAANLLGQTQLKACIGSLPALEEICSTNDLPLALMLWERQHHAAAQAARWAHLRGDKSPSECRIVAGCTGLPELMVCIYRPADYRAVLGMQNALGSQAASTQVLGTDFAALGREMVERWCLPELLDDAFRPDRHEFYRPLGIALASELARQVDSGWYTTRTVACVEVIADYLGLPFDRCADLVHQVAVGAARERTLDGAVSAAARLVQLPGEVPIAGVANATRKPPEKVKAYERQSQLQGVLLQAKQKLKGADLRTVLSTTMSVLHKQFQFPRCAFFLLDKGKSCLRARVVLGNGVEALQEMEIDTAGSRVFSSLLQKPQSLLVSKKNRERYAAHLPADFEKAAAESFACMSVFAGKRPLGLVYVDRQGAAFQADHYAAFKSLCGLVNQSLRVATEQASATQRQQAGSR